MDFSRLFHHRSKEHGAGRRAFASAREEQEATATIHYKTYPGVERIDLPRPAIACSLSEAIGKRKSSHGRGTPLSLEDVGALLGWGCGITERKATKAGKLRAYHRAQPSGGARFPIELYLLALKNGALPRGVYHYRVQDHGLECLFGGEVLDDVGDLFRYDWINDASAVFVMTGTFNRAQRKYGERGYRYILLEAGHIGQNLSLVGAARDLRVTMLGGTNDQALEALLDIDGITESVIYSAAASKPLTR